MSFHPRNFTFFNYDTVSFNEPQKVVQVESVTEVPFESQCRLALSTLLQQAEKSPKQFHYAKFPFGLMDVSALKVLLAFYDKRSEQKKVQEEKRWLTRNVISPFSKMSVSLSDMSSFFSQIWNEKHSKSEQTEGVRNLVGTRWLTDSDLTYI